MNYDLALEKYFPFRDALSQTNSFCIKILYLFILKNLSLYIVTLIARVFYC